MFHLTAIIEDTTIIATNAPHADDQLLAFDVILADGLTGMTARRQWTLQELTGVLALSLGGVGEDVVPGYDGARIWETVKPAVAGLPNEVNPVP